jgi:3-oxoacyl-[acyl-carrier protein] reductase
MIVTMASLPQRVALVTGSSRGLGAAIAQRLAQDGLAVAVNGLRDEVEALTVVDAIRDEGGDAAAFAADVTDEPNVAQLVGAVTDRWGMIDVLVVNATGRSRRPHCGRFAGRITSLSSSSSSRVRCFSGVP